jgi:hypothetical protein
MPAPQPHSVMSLVDEIGSRASRLRSVLAAHVLLEEWMTRRVPSFSTLAATEVHTVLG